MGIPHEPDPLEQLKTIQKLFPDKKRIGLMYSPEYSRINEAAIKGASTSMGLSLEMTAMNSIKEVPPKLQSLIPKVDLLWVVTDPVILSSHNNQFIVLQSISAKVPIYCGANSLAHAGATAALIPDLADAGGKAASQAKLILGGQIPGKDHG